MLYRGDSWDQLHVMGDYGASPRVVTKHLRVLVEKSGYCNIAPLLELMTLRLEIDYRLCLN
ncbi:hypothetical protein E2C01_041071 [Portunus trituberculatus]|uniref:Uncharacterized protein n=1 Tax=Portunus trituberculatus TaxID=210409 RepID=A0A5B7FPY9_PORTR|nr:hypothetical protein [Portunus trituberculatus]